MIQVGTSLPAVTLQEYSEVEGEGCRLGPNPVQVTQATAGKTIALFAVPGMGHANRTGTRPEYSAAVARAMTARTGSLSHGGRTAVACNCPRRRVHTYLSP